MDKVIFWDNEHHCKPGMFVAHALEAVVEQELFPDGLR